MLLRLVKDKRMEVKHARHTKLDQKLKQRNQSYPSPFAFVACRRCTLMSTQLYSRTGVQTAVHSTLHSQGDKRGMFNYKDDNRQS